MHDSINKVNSSAINPIIMQDQNTIVERAGTTNKKKLKMILLWNAPHRTETLIFGSGHDSFVDHKCPVSDCYIVNSPYQYPEIKLESYDAIVFNFHDLHMSKMPPNDTKLFQRLPHQRFVFLTQEAQPFLQHHILTGYRPNYFNWTMTYRLDSDILLLYGRITPTRSAPTTAEEIKRLINQSRSLPQQKKRNLAAAMISHCNTHGLREDYIKELKRYIPVDVYGNCDFNDNSTVDDNWNLTIALNDCKKSEFVASPPECYDAIEINYKFYLSFENAICTDYVTEKFFQIMTRNIVPVVYGGANYSRIAPPHSFIDARQFEPKELAEYLLRLDQDDGLYKTFFWWKGHNVVEAGEEQMTRHGFCELCRKLHQDNETKIYNPPMINKWFSINHQCFTHHK